MNARRYHSKLFDLVQEDTLISKEVNKLLVPEAKIQYSDELGTYLYLVV